MCSPTVTAGTPFPLGATVDAAGVNFAIFSAHADSIEVCLLDRDGAETPVRLPERTGDVWHGHVAGVGSGQRYTVRVSGPNDPARGHRFDPSVRLLDPYAKAVAGGAGRCRAGGSLAAVVTDSRFDWGGDTAPGTAWADTVLYELHVKGFTRLHPEVPAALRGTYAGLAHPAAVGHLTRLGVTAVELLPVHQFATEAVLARRGTVNYWGYASVGFFAPHGGYSSAGDTGGQVEEFKAMVRALHANGIEVVLDVVYNHTAEGGPDEPALAFRGLDNASYYLLDRDDPARYVDLTGCGNTLDLSHPAVLRLVLDSLRYWVTEMHVDGFRFDLASALSRTGGRFDPRSVFLAAVGQDPVLRNVKLIAEPWDCAPGGYAVGGFPVPWSEWNDRFRDGVRDVWRGAAGAPELARRLAGSSDLFATPGRRPSAGVNFVTCHDGFTLADLVSFSVKHNDANGEGNADGCSDNRSDNCGAEGPTADPGVLELRRRQVRNLLATLLLSLGVPMLTAGDELGRSQGGNNNAYCQDNETSWLDWSAGDDGLVEFTRGLLRFRAEHRVLRRDRFLAEAAPCDVTWFGADGRPLGSGDWRDDTRLLGMYLPAVGADAAGVLVVANTGREAVPVTLPDLVDGCGYRLGVSTAGGCPGGLLRPGAQWTAPELSVTAFAVRPLA